MAMNSVFSNYGGCDIANFNTDDCMIFNCTGCRVVNDYEKYSMTEKIAIRTALMWGAGIVSFITGFTGSGAVISFLPATVGILGSFFAHAGCAIVSGVVGGLIGAGAGLVDDAVIGGSERDHSNRGDIILQYAIIGGTFGFAGGLFGSFCPFIKEKMLENHRKLKQKKLIEFFKGADEDLFKSGDKYPHYFKEENLYVDVELISDIEDFKISHTQFKQLTLKVYQQLRIQALQDLFFSVKSIEKIQYVSFMGKFGLKLKFRA